MISDHTWFKEPHGSSDLWFIRPMVHPTYGSSDLKIHGTTFLGHLFRFLFNQPKTKIQHQSLIIRSLEQFLGRLNKCFCSTDQNLKFSSSCSIFRSLEQILGR